MYSPSFDFKNAFFDHQKVIKAMDQAERRAMSRQLAFIRRRWRSSLRRRKRISRPGQTPSVRSRDSYATLKNIRFAYDARTSSGVVGMMKIRQQNGLTRSDKPLPGLLEGGGSISIAEQSFNGRDWFPMRRRRNRSGTQKRRRRVHIAARPSGGPALDAEIKSGNIMSPWANVVSG